MEMSMGVGSSRPYSVGADSSRLWTSAHTLTICPSKSHNESCNGSFISSCDNSSAVPFSICPIRGDGVLDMISRARR